MALNFLELGITGKLISFEEVLHGVSDALVVRISRLIDTIKQYSNPFSCALLVLWVVKPTNVRSINCYFKLY